MKVQSKKLAPPRSNKWLGAHKRNIVLVGAVLILSACASSPASSQASTRSKPKPGLDSWLSSACPSTPAADVEAKALTDLADLLLGGAIDFLFDKVGTALAEAAKADKEGIATIGKSPSYLLEGRLPDADNKSTYALRSCLVVSLSNSSPDEWCAHEPFKSDTMCTGTVDIFDTDEKKTSVPRVQGLLNFPDGVPQRSGKDIPKFYAEIHLLSAPGSTAFIPQLQALYYPKGIHDSRKFSGDRKRDLSIKLTGTTPAGKPAVGTINVILKDVVPSAELLDRKDSGSTAILDGTEKPLWVAVAPQPKQLPGVDAGTGFNPVNLAAEVREIGDSNAFLQALAVAFAKNQEEISKELKSQILPGQVEKAEATKNLQDISNASALAAAVAKAYESEAKLVSACTVPTNAEPNKSKSQVRQHWSATHSAQLAVRKLEAEYKVDGPEEFGHDVVDTPFDSSASALDNCRDLGIST